MIIVSCIPCRLFIKSVFNFHEMLGIVELYNSLRKNIELIHNFLNFQEKTIFMAVFSAGLGELSLGDLSGHVLQGRRTFGHLDYRTPGFLQLRFSVATVFRFVARYARVRIEDSSRNRFVLNGIQGIVCFIVYSS